jgi:hypothetical protein
VDDYLNVAMIQFLVSIDPSGPKISDIPIPALFCSQIHRVVFYRSLEENALESRPEHFIPTMVASDIPSSGFCCRPADHPTISGSIPIFFPIRVSLLLLCDIILRGFRPMLIQCYQMYQTHCRGIRYAACSPDPGLYPEENSIFSHVSHNIAGVAPA